MTEGNLNTILDNFRASASKYFNTCPPHAWQAGAFSNYCYRLNGFPDDRKARKSAALTLWTDGLRRLAKDNDIDRKSHARKLLDASRSPSPPLYALGLPHRSSWSRLIPYVIHDWSPIMKFHQRRTFSNILSLDSPWSRLIFLCCDMILLWWELSWSS